MVIRRGRTPRLAVHGAGTALGRALVARLDGPAQVLADPASLSGVGTVVHAALSYDTRADPGSRAEDNVAGTARLLDRARADGVQRVVLVTSVDVCASAPGAALPLVEDLPLREAPDGPLTAELLEVERLADHATRTGLEVVVLRPACVVGGPLGPSYDGAALSALRGSRLLAVRGVEPLWQLCHGEDLLSALALAATSGLRGPAVVASGGWLSQREVEQLAALRRLELPAAVALSTAERLHRLGMSAGSPAELDRLLAPVVVDPARLREAGWAPAWTATEALLDHLSTRGDAAGGRPGTASHAGAYAAGTAAGATVALVGTAALVRRARRRRGR